MRVNGSDGGPSKWRQHNYVGLEHCFDDLQKAMIASTRATVSLCDLEMRCRPMLQALTEAAAATEGLL